AHLSWSVEFPRPMLGEMDTQLFEEFSRALAGNALMTLHVVQKAGSNAHHVAEAAFKAMGRALKMAVAIEPRVAGEIPSTKGSL
ncbi:MAG: imidazoleglycerol-phosphate dehydratase, partial [Acidocella sp.]|nr:imidazoleglycerol-phosphate dehydratase [Acidocella sp.]